MCVDTKGRWFRAIKGRCRNHFMYVKRRLELIDGSRLRADFTATHFLGWKTNANDDGPILGRKLLVHGSSGLLRRSRIRALCLVPLQPVPAADRRRTRLPFQRLQGRGIHKLGRLPICIANLVGNVVVAPLKGRHVGDEPDAGLCVLCPLSVPRLESLDLGRRTSRGSQSRSLDRGPRACGGRRRRRLDENLLAAVDGRDDFIVLPLLPVLHVLHVAAEAYDGGVMLVCHGSHKSFRHICIVSVLSIRTVEANMRVWRVVIVTRRASWRFGRQKNA